MSQSPSMPFFCDAYLGDTMDLSLEEHGAYLKLLMVTWRNNGVPLPDDDKRMARILGVSVSRWAQRLRPVLARFFLIENGTWRQLRLEKEWQFVEKFSAKQSANVGERWKRVREAKSLSDNNSQDTTVSTKDVPERYPQSQSHVEEAKASPTRDVHQTEFRREFETVFWPAYPVKSGKKPALGAFLKARERDTLEAIMAGLDRYKRNLALPNAPNSKMAQGWLNDERWKDEDSAIGGNGGRAQIGSGIYPGGGENITPLAGLFAGANLAIERREAERQAHRGADYDPAEPLLDSGGRPPAKGFANG